MCINKYRLWDRTQKITWFHILLVRNTSFPFFAVTRSPATFSQQRSCLAVQALASNLRLAMFWKTAVSPIHGLVWCPINTYNSFFQFCSRCRRLLCNCHLIFLTTLFSTLEPAREPDCHPNDTRIHTCKLGCLLPRKQSYCSKLYCISWIEFPLHDPLPLPIDVIYYGTVVYNIYALPLPSHGHF